MNRENLTNPVPVEPHASAALTTTNAPPPPLIVRTAGAFASVSVPGECWAPLGVEKRGPIYQDYL